MSVALEATNGHVQPERLHDFEAHDRRLADVIGDEVDTLRALLDDELTGRDQLAQLLERSRERERRLTRAIAVLEGNSPQGVAPQSKPAAVAAQARRDRKVKSWEPSAATIERVRAAFMRYWEQQPTPHEPFTMTVLAKWMADDESQGIGGETIRRTMETLRQREVVRVCGTTRGGGKLYAPMPGAAPDAA